MIKLSKLKNNPNNPRKISVLDFEKLKENIVRHPNILKIKPLVIDSWENPILLAGNQRFKALKDLGYEEISEDWVRTADTLTEKEKNAFVFLDNNAFGEYDYDILKELYNEDDLKEIESWGTDIPNYLLYNEDNNDITADFSVNKENDFTEKYELVIKISYLEVSQFQENRELYNLNKESINLKIIQLLNENKNV